MACDRVTVGNKIYDKRCVTAVTNASVANIFPSRIPMAITTVANVLMIDMRVNVLPESDTPDNGTPVADT